MALLFCDGFDSYSATADFTKKWYYSPSNFSYNATGGRFGGGAAQGGNGQDAMQKAFPTPIAAGSTIGFGFWVKYPIGYTGQTVRLTGNAGNFDLLTTVSGGFLRLVRPGDSAVLMTSTATIADAQWHWIELWFTAHYTATGAATLYIDGISQGSISSTATCQNSSVFPLTLFHMFCNNTLNVFYDDFIVWDSTGSDFNTSPIGPQRITTLTPNGDGASLQFTTNSGTTHYTQVTGGYSSANYVEDGGTGNIDLYDHTDLSYTPSTIKAVVANYWAQNPGTGNPNLIAKLRTGGTTISGSTFVLPSGGVNTLYQNAFYKDAAAAAWTAANVNAMQVGIGD